MMDQFATAMVSGAVALVVGTLSATVGLIGFRRERKRWLADLKVAYSVEMHKARIAAYPDALTALFPLSSASPEPPDAETASAVAERLNVWLYAAGGLFASATTRGAFLAMRRLCRQWAADGRRPDDLYEWRNLAVAFLRHDLDVPGLEDYDFDLESDPLGRFREELRRLEKETERRTSR